MTLFQLPASKISYREPWEVPPLKRLERYKRSSGKRIIYVYDRPDSSTFRYRVYNMWQTWRRFYPEVNAGFVFSDEIPALTSVDIDGSVVVLCRVRYTYRIAQFVKIYRLRGCRIYYDVDDLVFDSHFVELMMYTFGTNTLDEPALDYWHGYISRIRSALMLCDGVIVTNRTLAQEVEASCGLATAVIPNYLNQEQIDVSDAIFKGKASGDFEYETPTTIGYFSGTPSHDKDFRIAWPALENLLVDNSELCLLIVGYVSIPTTEKRVSDRIKFKPLTNYMHLQELIGSCEVNIVPLQDNRFTRCKSELKFFEAAITGTVTVASNVAPYSTAIADDVTGFLTSDHEWMAKLETALAARKEWPDMTKAAYKTALEKHSPSAIAPLLNETFFKA